MSTNASIVDVLLDNITTDQELLQEVVEKLEDVKNEKSIITLRLKEQFADIATFLKYANTEQQAKIEALGIDFSNSQKSVNSIATTAFDLIMKAKDNQLTNEGWYDGYVKSLSNKEDAVKYSEFNIKCRSLFNTQKLLRKKAIDGTSSREDIISLNGRVPKKEDEKTPVEDAKKPSLKAQEVVKEKKIPKTTKEVSIPKKSNTTSKKETNGKG